MKKYIFKNGKRTLPIGKIVCLARTYKKHAQEMHDEIGEEPLLFLKPASAVIFNNQSIIIPPMSRCLHHEAELGIVIGKKCKAVSQKNAIENILGYLLTLDITARDLQSIAKKHGWPWTISKGFDTFAPISDVVPREEVPNPYDLEILLKVNDVVKQHSNTKFMLYSMERIVEFVSCIMTLERGDLIMTGTPEGVGEIKAGDVIEAKLGDICSLKIDVRD
jgi:2-keto-4-pentenoate hydratase/2-oxohepta-3-ene-1,7-dioic acid hydratase in catechol pathway